MKPTRWVAVLFLSAMSLTAGAVDWNTVVDSGDYYYGEAEGETVESASQSALGMLLQSISVHVSSDFSKIYDGVTTPDGTDFTKTVRQCVETYSSSGLNNVEMMQKKQRSGFLVLRYMLKSELELTDDAARANWGGQWRMPSSAQIDELISECNTEWTTQNSVYGRKVTSKKNGKSIFLPAAGYRNGSSLGSAGSNGDYWSRSLNESYSYSGSAYYLSFYSSGFYRDLNLRYDGQSVRPVVSE